jgi:hypothetical protein
LLKNRILAKEIIVFGIRTEAREHRGHKEKKDGGANPPLQKKGEWRRRTK